MKKDALKNRFIWNYFTIAASNSPTFLQKFSKIVFFGVKFRAKFEVALQKQFPSIVANHSKPDFFYRKLSSRKRGNSLS